MYNFFCWVTTSLSPEPCSITCQNEFKYTLCYRHKQLWLACVCYVACDCVFLLLLQSYPWQQQPPDTHIVYMANAEVSLPYKLWMVYERPTIGQRTNGRPKVISVDRSCIRTKIITIFQVLNNKCILIILLRSDRISVRL